MLAGKRVNLLLLLAILITIMLLASALGSVSIPLLNIIKMGLNKLPLFDFFPTWKPSDEVIIFLIRLPRVAGGVLVGAALATAGVLFQGLLRNPMADPWIIGTSAGAALGATIAMLLPLNFFFLGFGLVPFFAFWGALAAVLLVYNLARVGGKTPIVSMLLAGFIINSVLIAIMYLLITLLPQSYLHGRVFSFLCGSISVSSWWQIVIISPLVIGGIIAARLLAPRLNAFSLGEEGAAYVGIEVERDKRIILGLGSLLAAAAVCLSGLVGFVGLVTPHAMRLLLGPDHRQLLPASAIAGASFVVLADLVARTIVAPQELLIGQITAPIGGIFFIYLLRRTRREYAF